VVTPEDGAIPTFTIIWDTARGHVLYLVPLREMVARTNIYVTHAADLRHFRRARHITGDCPLCGLVYSFTATRPVGY
jgi:hypothetical protein